MTSYRSARGLILTLTIAFTVVFGAAHLLFAHLDAQPQSVDPATHLRRAVNWGRVFTEQSPGLAKYLWLKSYGPSGEYTYPPLFHMICGVFLALGAPPTVAGTMANLVFMPLLIYSVMSIGMRAFGRMVGVLSGLLVVTYAFFALLAHNAFIDFALTAMLCWCIWRLLETDGFHSRRQSIWLGLSIGVGLLIKQMLAFFLAPVVVVVLLWTWRRWSKATWLNVAFAGGVSLAVALTWYGPHHRDVRNTLAFNQAVSVTEGDPMPDMREGILYYPRTLVDTQVGLPLTVMGVAAIVLWIVLGAIAAVRRASGGAWTRTEGDAQARLAIAAWFAFGLVGLTFCILNKDERYSAPILPAFALMTCSLLVWLRHRWMRVAMAAVILTAAAPYFTAIMADVPNTKVSIGFTALGCRWPLWGPEFAGGPRQTDWDIPELLDTLAQEAPWATPSIPVDVAVIPFLDRFGPAPIMFEAEWRRMPIRTADLGRASDVSALCEFDFVLLKTKGQTDPGMDFAAINAERLSEQVRRDPRFMLVARYPLPDSSQGELFRVDALLTARTE